MAEPGRTDRIRERLRATREGVRAGLEQRRQQREQGDAAEERTGDAFSGAGERSGLGLLRDRAAAAATLVGRGAKALAGHVRRLGPEVSHAWFVAPLWARQAAGGLLAIAALILLFAFLIIPNAPCAFPGGDRCPPDDDAIALVPADADAYIHVNLDPGTDQYESLADLGGRFGLLRDEALASAAALADRRVNYQRDVQPWSAGEIAVVLDGVSPEQPLLLFEVGDEEAAREFAAGLQKLPIAESEIDGVTVRTDRRGTAAAIAEGFLLLGPRAQLEKSIGLTRRGDSLGDSGAASDLLRKLPGHRVAEAYISENLTRFLGSRGRLGPLNTFVNADASAGVAVALSADDAGFGLAVRSGQDPEQSERSPDFFSALPAFEPKLPEAVNSDALAYLGVGDPAMSAATLFGQAAAFSPALFGGLESFNKRLKRRDGVDVEQSLLPLLTGEAALTVEPELVPGEEAATDELFPGQQVGVPYLALLAEGVDGDQALADLAELQGPVAAAVDPGAGQAPVFETAEIAGVDAFSLRLSSVVDLTYAAFDDKLVVGSSPLAVERVRAEGASLADSDRFSDLTAEFEDSLSLLLFLDLSELVLLGERAFLAADPSYAPFAPDLRLLEAAALGVRSGDGVLSTDLRVAVGAALDPIDAPPPAIDVAPG